MRTSALLVALALASPSAAEELSSSTEADRLSSRFELGFPAEVTLVGLTAGVRPEVLFRFGAPADASRVRFAVGLLAGPEQLFVPISLGYRAVYRQRHLVQPTLGAGLEVQLRIVTDYHPVRSLGVYLEGGVGFAVAPRWSVGALLTMDVMFVGSPGAGLGPRVYATWRL